VPTDPVFLDTVALVALTNACDGLHEQAVSIQRELAAARTSLVTTDWVMAEFLNTMSPSSWRGAAAEGARRLRRSSRVLVVEASRGQWDEAFELYTARLDKECSLVDCASVLLCERLSISRVFTSDRHFVQAGLTAMLA
jgi:predicted nucleic acid-binding protein